MHSLEGIRYQSRVAARRTAHGALRPYIVEADDLADFHLTIRAGVDPSFPFPFLSSYEPPGFIATGNRYLIAAGESGAARFLPLVKKLWEGFAYAVSEAGLVQEYEVSQVHGPYRELRSRQPERVTVPLDSVEGFMGRIVVGATVIFAPYSGTSLREATVTRLRARDGRVEIVVKQHNQRGTGSLLRYPQRVLVKRLASRRRATTPQWPA